MTIPPGGENQLCWFTTMPNLDPVWVRRMEWYQADEGHHLTVYSTTEDVPDGTVQDCTGAESMSSWLPFLTGTSVDRPFELPEGLAVHVKPQLKLVLQTHYVNTNDKPIRIRDVGNLYYGDAGVDYTPAASWATTNLTFSIPPMQETKLTYEITVEQEQNVFVALGHLHEYGASFSIDAGSPGALQNIYDVAEWDSSYRDVPPLVEWQPDSPLALKPGDKMRVTCHWNNPTQEAIAFPAEMCATVMWFYPSLEPVIQVGVPTP
jgi:hypothetical protein